STILVLSGRGDHWSSTDFVRFRRDAKRIPYKYEIQILRVGDGLPVPKFLFDKLEFGGVFK
ncbi:MAG: hypothetical protein IKT61_03495, partial [Clostridia bacterium]|nr:hypothetical protein [Clostridia bacterium]